jgi:hypothetical protein
MSLIKQVKTTLSQVKTTLSYLLIPKYYSQLGEDLVIMNHLKGWEKILIHKAFM